VEVLVCVHVWALVYVRVCDRDGIDDAQVCDHHGIDEPEVYGRLEPGVYGLLELGVYERLELGAYLQQENGVEQGIGVELAP